MKQEAARIQVGLAAEAAGLAPLAEIDTTVGDLTRVQPLLEQLAAAVGSLLGTDRAVVWTTDPSRQLLVPVAWVGFDNDYIGPIRVPYGAGSAGRAVSERGPVHICDVEASTDYAPWATAAVSQGVRAVLSVPMLTLGGEPVGALSSYFRTTAPPQARDLELADVYARQAAEIVERARLHSASLQLAVLERRRGSQLRALADRALALSAADDLDELLALVTEAAVAIVGTHQGATARLLTGWQDATTYVSLSETYAAWRDYAVMPKGLGVVEVVVRSNRPLRLTSEQLLAHPEWRGLKDAPAHPPLPDYLAAPLIGRDGANLGLIQLSHKLDDTAFTAEDEAMLVQLAQMASSTVERMEALAGERAARLEAEQTAAAQAVLSEASSVFAELFEPDGIAQALVGLLVPRLAELAVLHVLDADGQVTMAAVETLDPADRQAAHEFFADFPVDLEQAHGAGAALRTGQPQPPVQLTDDILRAASPDVETAGRLACFAHGSVISVPLVARGRTVGALSLMRDEPYAEAVLAQAVDLARRAALALDNANRYAFERDVAVTLQKSLLPRRLATGTHFTAAARYLPGAQGTQVGGDWYDLIELADGVLFLVVGDVMGSGVAAAAQMGQLQATVRAYALEGHGPAQVLQRLDRVVQAVDDLHFTTCVVARVDPWTGRAVLASAGHLPPLLCTAAGQASLVELEPGLPLGVGDPQFSEREVQVGRGGLLLLYTDGLVESRTAPIGEGLERLSTCLRGPVRSAEAACDEVLAALGRDGGHDDDTAVLALLLSPAEGGLELRLPGLPASAALARRAMRELIPGDSDVAQLLVTEMVANAVRHVGVSELVVRAAVTATGLRVEVVDASTVLPTGGLTPSHAQESGRGLLLLDALARAWGVQPRPGGKCVWFELDLEPG
ncbi:MAG: SpoIIE family protein phosphatase [Frankiales bacterium]|nr:SpoIIE family protein phosphatase [Frankiales bacterium]